MLLQSIFYLLVPTPLIADIVKYESKWSKLLNLIMQNSQIASQQFDLYLIKRDSEAYTLNLISLGLRSRNTSP